MAFPNVPVAPGVPALPRDLGAELFTQELLQADSPSLFSGLDTPLWGLFLNGSPVVVADTVLSFDFKQGYTIATFPVEEGAFESYDKVQRPFDVRFRFATGGSLADRQALLESVKTVVGSLDVLDAVTPAATYQGVNATHYDYRQTSTNGVGMIVVDVLCEQVRVVASSGFTTSQQQQAAAAAAPASGGGTTGKGTITITPVNSPQSASASPRVSDGTVQPVPIAAGDPQFNISDALP